MSRQFPHFPQFPLPRLRKVIAHAVKAWSGDRAIKFVFRNFRYPASAPKMEWTPKVRHGNCGQFLARRGTDETTIGRIGRG
jgi:hypothetical protein